jgi:aminomuconate-semialdehyde/2-hydroxymuconate-6-semialdehyde dehydrogenase
MIKKIANFIANQFVPPANDKYLENKNPSTGSVISMIPLSSSADVTAAVNAAKLGFQYWRTLGPKQRSDWMLKLADAIESRKQVLAEIESEDQGKPVELALKSDLNRVVNNFRFFAAEILQPENLSFKSDLGADNHIVHEPVGVAGLISPWNLPLYLLTWKIAPAIAYGNAVVCKPSEFTSHSADALAKIIQEIDFPKGVINIVYGKGFQAGQALIKNKDVPVISFTGGTATGTTIAWEASSLLKRLSLELGGKNPNIIFADCDFEKALETSIRSSFLNQGEICLCGSRIYVQKSLAQKFISAFVAEVKKLKVGDPRKPETFMGPLVSEQHLNKVKSYIEKARQEGAQILTGGDSPRLPESFDKGYFLNPTVITGLKQASVCMQEEIFGPVVSISEFETEADAIELANDVIYGLSATVWTTDKEKALRVANAVQAGTVWVNSWMIRDLRVPFGGMKASGLGREGGKYSRDFYTNIKNICIKDPS